MLYGKSVESFAFSREPPKRCPLFTPKGLQKTISWEINFLWCLGAESNHRQADFQSAALPTELLGHYFALTIKCLYIIIYFKFFVKHFSCFLRKFFNVFLTFFQYLFFTKQIERFFSKKVFQRVPAPSILFFIQLCKPAFRCFTIRIFQVFSRFIHRLYDKVERNFSAVGKKICK